MCVIAAAALAQRPVIVGWLDLFRLRSLVVVVFVVVVLRSRMQSFEVTAWATSTRVLSLKHAKTEHAVLHGAALDVGHGRLGWTGNGLWS